MAEGAPLATLREQPFELLREMERRARAALAGHAGAAGELNEWVGIGFRIDDERFVVSRDEVREVLMMPDTVTRIPGARRWVLGLANVRGHLLPISDLKMMLGAGRTAMDRRTRVVAVNHREVPAGLLVDEVFGFRRFVEGEFRAEWPPTVLRCDRYLGGAFERRDEVWPVFSLHELLESEEFLQAAE